MGDILTTERTLNYYTMDSYLAYKIHYATMETTFLFARAVLNFVENPDILARFGLPQWS